MFIHFFPILLMVGTISTFENYEHCGVVDDSVGLIIGGDQIKPNEFPWGVAIFQKISPSRTEFICGGTLISRTKVITAAHCIQNKYSMTGPTKPSQLVLKLGFYDISKIHEIGSKTIKPSNITIHPDWDIYSSSYDADIAVIELPYKITVSKLIRPICMWERRRGPPQVSEGVVAGWGLTSNEERKTALIARKLTLPVITNEYCFLEKPTFATSSSNRTFCAGAKNGAAPCQGDSGSGLFFKFQGRSYLGGIVSASTLSNMNCDTNSYALFTEVYKFILWLRNKKFSGKSKTELACDSYKRKPRRPDFIRNLPQKSNEAELGEFPHMALISYATYDFINDTVIEEFHCNGFLITDRFVVTAAHCLTNMPDGTIPVSVRLGAVSNQTMDADNKTIAVDINILNYEAHEDFSNSMKIHDIGLVQLEKPATFSYFIWPTCLYSKPDDELKRWILSGLSVEDANSKLLNQTTFLRVSVEEIPLSECKAKLANAITRPKIYIINSHLCGTETNVNRYLCHGNSGAPLQILIDNVNYVGGFSSFRIFLKGTGPGCTDRNNPSIYTRIASYLDWIEERVWPDEDSEKLEESTTVKTRQESLTIEESTTVKTRQESLTVEESTTAKTRTESYRIVYPDDERLVSSTPKNLH